MVISLELALYILLFFIVADIVLISGIIYARVFRRIKKLRRKHVRDFFLYKVSDASEKEKEHIFRAYRSYCVEEYIDLSQNHILDNKSVDEIQDYFRRHGIDKIYIRRLKSIMRFRRIKSALYLGYIGGSRARNVLERRIVTEKKYSARIYMAYSLTLIRHKASVPFLVRSLLGSPKWYQRKAHMLIAEYGRDFYDYIPNICSCTEKEISYLLIHFASVYIAADLKHYLLECTKREDNDIVYAALRALSHFYYFELNSNVFLKHADPVIRNIAIEGISNIATYDTVEKLISFVKEPEVQRYCIAALVKLSHSNPTFLNTVSMRFSQARDESLKKALAQVLATRLEYFIAKLLSPEKYVIRKMIAYIFEGGGLNGIIGFLNRNTNIEVENEVLSCLRASIEKSETIRQEIEQSLEPRVLAKLSLRPVTVHSPKTHAHEKDKFIILAGVLLIVALAFPALFYFRHKAVLFGLTFVEMLKIYIIDFNYYFVYYVFSINALYIIMLGFSLLGCIRQINYWRLKKMSMLFKHSILPSVSIIAPAYCEEASIIESVNSLLTLQYPNYDLIVVNDGSSDQTLARLVDYFKLERVDLFVDVKIQTKTVLGVYKNKAIPKLTVVDKVNGGKADSLNAGINFSRKEYFCGIDADSLLEPQALIKVVSPALDYEEELVASGGNILPANGAKIERGMLTEINIPKSRIARFQTIEYLRAFMAGRVGWAYIKSLAIISGAFGLLKKKRVIDIGGYLSEESRYHKNTVGEDMELVVRLNRQMQESKRPHRIVYAFNANCWTEVPEDISILYRQRDRWQRALIDILVFHRHILFNPAYKQMGLIAFPYFFFFEFIGPLIEAKGYILVVAAAFLGLLNAKLAILLFTSSVMMGTLISIMSVLIANQGRDLFRPRETAILIWYAIIENFGFRQLLGFWRVSGYFSSMRSNQGWGKMVHKGFGGADKGAV